MVLPILTPFPSIGPVSLPSALRSSQQSQELLIQSCTDFLSTIAYVMDREQTENL